MHKYESLTHALQGRTDIQKYRKTFSALKCDFSVASSSRTAHPSLPRKRESSVIPLLLLSRDVHSALRGFPTLHFAGSQNCTSRVPDAALRGFPKLHFVGSRRCTSWVPEAALRGFPKLHFVGSRSCAFAGGIAHMRGLEYNKPYTCG